MNLYKHMATLLAVTTAVATSQTGHTYRIETSNEDGVKDHEQDFQIYFYGSQSGGASSPTSQLKIQTSPDNVNWVDNVESTQLTATGDMAENKSHATLPLMRYIRAVTTLGGGTNPDHTCEVRLLSTGPFRLKSVS